MQPIDQDALMVGLARLQADPQPPRQLQQAGVHVGQGRVPVNPGLALAQEVEVGAVQDQQVHRRASV
ncbi:hypothetical protein D3C72_2479120 [compost metagenome]